MKSLTYKAIAYVTGIGGIGAFCVGLGIIVWQIKTWLSLAVWPRYSLGDHFRDLDFSYPYTSMLGWQKIINAILSWPTSVTYLVAGFSSMIVGFAVAEFVIDEEFRESPEGKVIDELIEKMKRASHKSDPGSQA